MTLSPTSPMQWLLFFGVNVILNVNFVIIYVMLTCAKKKMAPTKSTGTTSQAPAGPVNPSGSTTTTPSTNVKFADNDDPKNKSTYGVDESMFKRKKVDPNHDKEKLKKDMEAEMSAPPSKEDKKKSTKELKDSKKEKKNPKKKDDSDKTDLRSLTLERNLMEAKTQANIKKAPEKSQFAESPAGGSDKPKPSGPKLVSSPSNMPNTSQRQNRSSYL